MNNSTSSPRLSASLLVVLQFVMVGATTTIAASNKNVWLESPYTREAAQDMVVCLGNTVGFEARTQWDEGLTWSWSGATRTSAATNHPSYAEKSYNTAGGPYSVTATYKGETSYAARVRVVEVTSLTPSSGILVANSSPPKYVACPGTTITVTATSNPVISENLIPDCWDFSGGDPIGLGKLQRRVTLGLSDEVTFTVVAGTSTKTIVLASPQVTLSFTPGYDIIANNSSYVPPLCRFYQDAFAVTHPDVGGLNLQLSIAGASPYTADRGSVSFATFTYNASQHRYEGPTYFAKHEAAANKCATDPYLAPQTVTLQVMCAGQSVATADVSVVSQFSYLVAYMRHNDAIEYVRWKYGIGDPDYRPSYDPNLGDYGQTSIFGTTTIGPAAFSTENELASTLIHERVHYYQGYLQRLAAGAAAAQYAVGMRNNTVCPWPVLELEAYQVEQANFSSVCLSSSEQNTVYDNITYYSDIGDECGCF